MEQFPPAPLPDEVRGCPRTAPNHNRCKTIVSSVPCQMHVIRHADVYFHHPPFHYNGLISRHPIFTHPVSTYQGQRRALEVRHQGYMRSWRLSSLKPLVLAEAKTRYTVISCPQFQEHRIPYKDESRWLSR